MWCRHCLREVNASSTGLSGGTCPLCGRKTEPATRQTDAIRQAREILERWQSSDLFDRISSTESLPERKQQDTVPLPGLPLHRSTQPTASTVSRNEAPAPPATVETERTQIGVPVQAANPVQSHQKRTIRPIDPLAALLGDLIAPKPFLATAAPPMREDQSSRLPQKVVSEVPTAAGKPDEHQGASANASAMKAGDNADSNVIDDATEKLFSEDLSFDDLKELRTSLRDESVNVLQHASTDDVVAEKRHDSELRLHLSDDISESTESPESDDRTLVAEQSAVVQSAQSLAAASPSLLAIASVQEESNRDATVSAESANQQQSTASASPMKTQRNPLKRPPLQRRIQPAKAPVNSVQSETGTDPMTKKFRIDVPGEQESLQEAPASTGPINSSVAPETRIVSNSPKPGRRLRIDSAESLDDISSTDGRRARTQGLPHHRYIDEPHGNGVRGPHFEVSSPRRSNLTSIIGQSLAYLGVLGLTIGTSMVIYGHFGGYAEYTPTGWLVTTVAQMLLFLGVINLVSGGIEQNNEDVSRRINSLGEQLVRIEQVTSEVLRGPKISPRLYADPDDEEAAASSRETVGAEQDRT